MTSPATKRRKLDLHSSSINDPSSEDDERDPRCLFDTLPVSIFPIICSFLELEIKCALLPMLNRAILNLFEPSTCCREPHMWIDINNINKSVADHIKKVIYLQFAASITVRLVHHTCFGEDSQVRVTNALVDSVSNPFLTDISFTERESAGQSVLSRFLSVLQQRSVKQLRSLETLYIQYQTDFAEPAALVRLMNWAGLSHCQSLVSLSICLSDFSTAQLENVIQSVPSSLTSIDLNTTSRTQLVDHGVLDRALRSPTFLPRLTRLFSVKHSDLLDSLSTVMNETGQTRPIACLHLTVGSRIDLSSFHALTSLQARLQSQYMTVLSHLSDRDMPQLSNLKITVTTETVTGPSAVVDVSPIFIFASVRPIRTFEIDLHNKFVDNTTEYPFTSLSAHAISAWSDMHALTSMTIDGLEAAFDCNCILEHGNLEDLPVDSWPCLTNLTLDGCALTPQCALAALKAAPLVEHLSLRDCTFKWLMWIPAILECCPTLLSLTANTGDDSHSLTQLQQVYHDYPLTALSGPNLTQLSMSREKLENDMFHFLCTQFRVLPCLEHFGHDHDETLFRTAIKVRLPNLNQVSPDERDSTAAWNFVPVGDSPVSCFKPDLEFYLNDFFRTLDDNPPLHGRAAYQNLVLARLSPEERDLLARWDTGDYSPSAVPVEHAHIINKFYGVIQ